MFYRFTLLYMEISRAFDWYLSKAICFKAPWARVLAPLVFQALEFSQTMCPSKITCHMLDAPRISISIQHFNARDLTIRPGNIKQISKKKLIFFFNIKSSTHPNPFVPARLCSLGEAFARSPFCESLAVAVVFAKIYTREDSQRSLAAFLAYFQKSRTHDVISTDASNQKI